MPLNPKQLRFCEEYVIDLNATQAAIRSGYSQKAAKEVASRMLTNANIKAKIKELQSEIGKRLEITADMVVREFAKIGFSNIQDYIESGNSTLDISKIQRDKAASISALKVITSTHGTGKDKVVEKQVEFKLHDKISALEKIGKHIGFFEKDNSQQSTKIVVKLK